MTQKRRNKRNISGWIVLDKPFDVTSTQAVGKLKFLFEAKKAGHAGTLDPLATGILPIALGEATKTVPYIQDGEKIYRFDLVWGSATETDDAEGAVTETSDSRPTEDEVRAALPQFTGVINQIPPAYSAIKIKGERAYDLARAGEKVEVPPREVEIEAFELVSHSPERSSFEVTCQKGTYVRALARDLARLLGTCGHVGALRRTRVGPFAEEDAVTVDELEAVSRDERDTMLLPVSAGITDLLEINVDTRQAATIRLGNPVLLTGANAPIAMDEAAAICAGELIAIGYVEKGQFKPSRVILPS